MGKSISRFLPTPSRTPEECERHYTGCLIVNRALNEVACEPVDVEGQRPIGMLPETTRLGYIEMYFDHRRWGEDALGRLAAAGALRDPAFAGAHLLHVEEPAALDNRQSGDGKGSGQ